MDLCEEGRDFSGGGLTLSKNVGEGEKIDGWSSCMFFPSFSHHPSFSLYPPSYLSTGPA
jgi:hypothetical protein